MSNYPAGVTDATIDYYFGDCGASCATCRWNCNGICDKKEDAINDDYTVEEIAEMTSDEHIALVSVDDDDYCDGYEEKDEIPDYVEDGWRDWR